VRIDTTTVAIPRTRYGKQRPLTVWQQCRVPADEGSFPRCATYPASFRSRYNGPISALDARSCAAGVGMERTMSSRCMSHSCTDDAPPLRKSSHKPVADVQQDPPSLSPDAQCVRQSFVNARTAEAN